MKTKFPRAVAMQVARQITTLAERICLPGRLMVAGSLRRGCAEVGDLEIVYISQTDRRKVLTGDLFAPERWEEYALMDACLDTLLRQGVIAKRLNAKGSTMWGPSNKFAVHCATGLPVDFFTTEDDGWWSYVVCRTGPGALNIALASAFQRQGRRWQPYRGVTAADGQLIRFEDEEAVFTAAGWPWLEPHERTEQRVKELTHGA
jgi:DNA polymerase/3'-5' exonuclease PolX